MIPDPEPPTPELGDRSWRSKRPDETFITYDARVQRQKALLRAACASWLVCGRPVRVLHDAGFGLQGRADMTRRTGVVARVPGPPFTDYVYVRFAPIGRQRVERTVLLELEAVAPVEPQTRGSAGADR